jgi:broad specificity phosphatase PhoE
MSKPLILVKHSVPEIQNDRPARAWKLSPEGRLRAQLLSERMRSYPVEAVFSSVEPKAVETAQIIAAACDVELQVVEGLQEHDRSNVPYLARPEFESAVQQFFRQPDTLVFGRETADQAYERFSDAITSLLEKYKNQEIVIVAHGTVISLFVSRLTGTSAFLLWEKLGLPSFVVIDIDAARLITMENFS